MSSSTFLELGVAAEICEGLADRNISEAFAIQQLTLPVALRGKDVIGQARTGMGKTYAFGIPVLDRVFDDASVTPLDGSVRALIVVPTRELCLQVTSDLQIASSHLKITEDGGRPMRVQAIYGGVSIENQRTALRDGADVVVGTPGRLLDLYKQGVLALRSVEIAVLDEADEMLDQGFLEDVQELLAATDPGRQTLLFSATMPGPIMALTREFMQSPIMIQADSGATEATHQSTRQIVFQSHKLDRMSALSRVLQTPGRGSAIVFCRTKRQAAFVAKDLAEFGFRVGAVHGDMKQNEREESLRDFRQRHIDIMVATDVAARGIDVDDVTHVINYQALEDERTYVHRIGRTGRAGKAGTAVTLLGWDEVDRWNTISSALDLGLADPPQWFSNSPDFLAEFDLPSDVHDSVGPAQQLGGSQSALAPAQMRGKSLRGSRR